jgi:hypothetical protein
VGTLLAGALLSAGVLSAVLVPQPVRAADQTAPSRRLFTIADPDVFESSGLVDRGRTVFTTNDSGDDAVIYELDARSGREVGRTTYADSVDDVEALAPGPGGAIWTGDIGDNRGRRDDIAAYRVTPGRGDAPRFTLTYPDGAHDAETLLVHPRTGRLLVVSKSVFGGTVYVAPRRPQPGGAPNRLHEFARVGGLVTDGTFFPGGRRVLLRTYGTATAYTFPGFAPVGTVRLPSQPQGEGISVAQDGRVLVSSEGVRSQVLQVTLPPSFTASSASPTAAPLPPREPAAPSPPSPGRSASDWGWVALAAAGIGSLGYLAVRGSRLRGPRRR